MRPVVRDPAPSTAASPLEERLTTVFRLLGFGGVIAHAWNRNGHQYALRMEDGTQIVAAYIEAGVDPYNWEFEEPFLKGSIPAVLLTPLYDVGKPVSWAVKRNSSVFAPHVGAEIMAWSTTVGSNPWAVDNTIDFCALAVGVWK